MVSARMRSRSWLTGVSRAALASLSAAPIVILADAAAAQTTTQPPASPPATAPATASQAAPQEIVVTAQFRAQNLQKTPLAITAVTGKMLEARGQTNVDQIANEAPNVTLKPGLEVIGPSMLTYIRGIGQSDFDPAYAPGVGIYIDDVYYGTITGTDFNLLDLDRVEILRGPQGTLSGQNSIGGSIKLYNKQPNGSDDGFVQVGYGSYNQVELKGAGDFTIVPDQLFMRIAGYSDHQDGYVTQYDYGCTHPTSGVPSQVLGPSCILGHEGGKADEAGRVSLRWNPDSKFDATFSADVTENKDEASPLTLLYVGSETAPGIPGLPVGKAYAPPTLSGVPLGTATGSAFVPVSMFEPSLDTFTHSPYVSYANFCDADPDDKTAAYCMPAIQNFSSWGVSGNLNYKFNDEISLKSITSYRYQDADWTQDGVPAPVNSNLTYNHTDVRQFTEELRLSGAMNDNTLHWTVGGFYLNMQSHYSGRIDLYVFDFNENDSVPASTEAGFANVDWNATDKLELSGGVRYTENQQTFTFGRLGVPGTVAGTTGFLAPYVPCNGPGTVPVSALLCGLNGLSAKYSGGHFDYRLAAQYQWTPDFMTYASVATGYKQGGVSPRPFFAPQAVPFGPETNTAFEIGFKSQWLDRRLIVNGDVFYSLYDKMQLTTLTCPQYNPTPPGPGVPGLPCSLTVNAGDSILDGVELESSFRPTPELSIDATMSYLHFNFVSSSLFKGEGGLAAAEESGFFPNTQEPYAPQWKYDIGVQYAFPLSDWGSVTPRLDLSYQSSFYSTIPNTRFSLVPGYALLNGSVTWRPNDGKWVIAAQVYNITNKLYYYGIFDATASGDSAEGEPAPPREFEITVRRNF